MEDGIFQVFEGDARLAAGYIGEISLHTFRLILLSYDALTGPRLRDKGFLSTAIHAFVDEAPFKYVKHPLLRSYERYLDILKTPSTPNLNNAQYDIDISSQHTHSFRSLKHSLCQVEP